MTNTTYITVQKTYLQELASQLASLSRTLEKILKRPAKTTSIPYIPLASKEERLEYLHDKDVQKTIAQARQDIIAHRTQPLNEVLAELEKENS